MPPARSRACAPRLWTFGPGAPNLSPRPGAVPLWLAGYLDAAADRIDVRLAEVIHFGQREDTGFRLR